MKSKINFDKLTKFIKSKNFLIAVGVFALTMISIGVSYASFFTVKTNSNNQSITTGTLNVSYGSKESAINRNNMISMSDEEGMKQSEATVIHIQNTGSLDSTFVLNVGYDMENFLRSDGSTSGMLTPIDYIKLAIFEYNGSGEEDTLIAGPISIADLPIYNYNSNDSRYNRYSVLFNTVGSTSSGNATKTYKIKMWLSDKAIPAASYSYFYVNSEIVAEVENAKMKYNWTGILNDTSNVAVAGAKISLQNGSLVSTTDSTGAFSLNGIYPGVYNVDIAYNDNVYSGNITVSEGGAVSATRPTVSFKGMDIYAAANTYGTTTGKIIKKNSLDTYTEAVELDSATTYRFYSSYKVIGGLTEGMNINIKLNNAYGFILTVV